MNMRFGNCEKGLMITIIGMMPFVLLIIINRIIVFSDGSKMPFWYSLIMILGMFLMFMGQVWIIYIWRKNRLSAIADENEPGEITMFRVTRDGVGIPQRAKIGAFGTAETQIYGQDADFLIDNDFPMKCINGNSLILVYDMINVSVNPQRSVARKFMRKHASDGLDAYKLAKQEGKVAKDAKEEKQ